MKKGLHDGRQLDRKRQRPWKGGEEERSLTTRTTADTNNNQRMSSSQPAHNTKHVPFLISPFVHSTFTLSQLADGVSNGTALWLAGQCLALYLAHNHPQSSPHPRAIELGSGIGFTASVSCAFTYMLLITF
jgi:hypothetical protein